MKMLTTKDVQTRMGLMITADFITNVIGVEPTNTAGKASLWSEDAYEEIATKTAEFITNTIEEPAEQREKRTRRSRKAGTLPPVQSKPATRKQATTTTDEEEEL